MMRVLAQLVLLSIVVTSHAAASAHQPRSAALESAAPAQAYDVLNVHDRSYRARRHRHGRYHYHGAGRYRYGHRHYTQRRHAHRASNYVHRYRDAYRYRVPRYYRY